MMDQRNCPKHVEFHFKNKFEKLVHLVGFIIEMPCYLPISTKLIPIVGHVHSAQSVEFLKNALNRK